MRNTWLASIATVLIVAGSVQAADLGNSSTTPTWWGGPAASSVPAGPTLPQTAAMAEPVRPSSQISPLQNPVKYLGAAFSEFPLTSVLRWEVDRARQMASGTPAPPDSIALETPTGPPSPQLFIALAQMSERQGNIDQARSQYKQAMTIWPGNIDVLRAAGRMEDRLSRLDLAEYLYQQAAASDPHNAGVLNDLGLCLARQGKLEQAVQTIEQAIHLKPDKSLYRNNVATVLIELRQDRKALAHLTAVHSSAEANYNMGQLLVQRDRSDEAQPYFVAALQQDPNLQDARIALAKLCGQTDGLVATSENVTPIEPASEDGPQLTPEPAYPPTAQAPVITPVYPIYVPPGYQAPTGVPVTTIEPSVGIMPRHLPPIGIEPSGVNR